MKIKAYVCVLCGHHGTVNFEDATTNGVTGPHCPSCFDEYDEDEELEHEQGFDENDWADDRIKAAKEEPEYYRSIL